MAAVARRQGGGRGSIIGIHILGVEVVWDLGACWGIVGRGDGNDECA